MCLLKGQPVCRESFVGPPRERQFGYLSPHPHPLNLTGPPKRPPLGWRQQACSTGQIGCLADGHERKHPPFPLFCSFLMCQRDPCASWARLPGTSFRWPLALGLTGNTAAGPSPNPAAAFGSCEGSFCHWLEATFFSSTPGACGFSKNLGRFASESL